MSKNNCNSSQSCSGECPETMSCPLDVSYPSKKDRSTAQIRRNNKEKEKQTDVQNAKSLFNKAAKLSNDIPLGKSKSIRQKAKNAQKKVDRIK